MRLIKKILLWSLVVVNLTIIAVVALFLVTLEVAAPGLIKGVAQWVLSESELTELASATSADGKFVAAMYLNPGGGAATETSYVLYLWEAGDNEDRHGPLLVARRLTYPRLAWNGSVLNVSYGYARLDWYRGSWQPPFCFDNDCKVEIRMKPDCSPCGTSHDGLQTEQIWLNP